MDYTNVQQNLTHRFQTLRLAHNGRNSDQCYSAEHAGRRRPSGIRPPSALGSVIEPIARELAKLTYISFKRVHGPKKCLLASTFPANREDASQLQSSTLYPSENAEEDRNSNWKTPVPRKELLSHITVLYYTQQYKFKK